MSTFKGVAVAASWIAISRAISIGSMIAVQMVIVRLGSASVLGQYTYFVGIYGLACLLALPGMPLAVQRAAARGAGPGIAWRAAAQQAMYGTLGSIGLVVGAAITLRLGRQQQAGMLLVAAALLPFSVGGESLLNYWLGARLHRMYAIAVAIARGLVPVGAVVSLLLAKHSLVALAPALLVPPILLYPVFWWRWRGKLAPRGSEESDLRYGRRCSGVSILGGIKTNGVVVLLGNCIPSAQLGLFAVADRFAGLVKEAVFQVNMQQITAFAAATTDGAYSLLTRSIRIGTPIVAAAAVLTFGASIPVIRVFYGPTVLACLPLLAVGLIAKALEFPGNQCNTWFASRALLRKQYVWIVVTSTAEIAAVLTLVPWHGAMGVMFARIVAAGTGTVAGLWLACSTRPARV